MSRSLRASEDGIKQIKKALKQAGFTQTELAKELGISRSTITVLLKGEAIARANFEELCQFLALDWRDIRGEDIVSDDIELLAQEVKQKIAADVTERCGTMRVLDMTKPVELDRIYTHVNILKDVTGRRRIGYDEVIEVCTREHFDRFLMGTIQERVTGFEAVEEFQKLVVLGKPGAGKTTFMKYLAMSCLGGKFHGELVPIFVTLKVYAETIDPKTKSAPSLQEYIFGEMHQRKVARDVVERLLEEGRGLILLDGLDEVKKEDDRRVKQDIDKFSRDWLKNRFAITCRIAAREYQFEKFTEVEVADFDDKQIKEFVNNWFREKDKPKAVKLLEKLEDNEPVKELAKNPLLLTLLCLVFGERNDFPPKRSELYREGLEVLIKKWDAKRNIEREQIYKHLSPQNKEDMLGQIAFNTFVKGEYFFRQEDLQCQIKDYIYNLPEASADPEALRIDSEVVLKAIEHHHGLLVERARNIYSFSHLTFQEYFTAREIERERQLETLILHITEPRWKEVFLLTAEILRRSDDFLRLMKEKIDGILVINQKLQDFLWWINSRSLRLPKKYNLSLRRSIYIDLLLYCGFYNNRGRFRSHPTLLANKLGFSWELDEQTIILDYLLSEIFQEAVNLSCGGLYVPLWSNVNDHCNIPYVKSVACQLKEKLTYLETLTNANDLVELNRKVPTISREFYESISQDNESFEKILREVHNWWKEFGGQWLEEYRNYLVNEHNIGHDWEFTDEQAELLNKYYEANLLLVECMNCSYVSKQVREEIESTLLLPVKEKGERKQEKNSF